MTPGSLHSLIRCRDKAHGAGGARAALLELTQ